MEHPGFAKGIHLTELRLFLVADWGVNLKFQIDRLVPARARFGIAGFEIGAIRRWRFVFGAISSSDRVGLGSRRLGASQGLDSGMRSKMKRGYLSALAAALLVWSMVPALAANASKEGVKTDKPEKEAPAANAKNPTPKFRLDQSPLPRDTPMAQDRKSTRLNSSHVSESRMPSSA